MAFSPHSHTEQARCRVPSPGAYPTLPPTLHTAGLAFLASSPLVLSRTPPSLSPPGSYSLCGHTTPQPPLSRCHLPAVSRDRQRNTSWLTLKVRPRVHPPGSPTYKLSFAFCPRRGPQCAVAPRAAGRGNQAEPLRPCPSWLIHLPPSLQRRLQRRPRRRGPPNPVRRADCWGARRGGAQLAHPSRLGQAGRRVGMETASGLATQPPLRGPCHARATWIGRHPYPTPHPQPRARSSIRSRGNLGQTDAHAEKKKNYS